MYKYVNLKICIVNTLFCSFLCLAGHCMFFYFQPFPPHLQGKNPTKFIPGKPPGHGGETGWMRMSPLTHLAAPAESMSCPSTVIWAKSWCKQNTREDFKNHWVFCSCFLLDESDLPTQLSSSWNSPTFWGRFLLAKNSWILWGGVRGHS